jgi:hypothetical protein
MKHDGERPTMKNSNRKAAVISIASVVVSAAPRIANACAMCGLSPGDSAGHAYNTSVLFMLVGPYLTFGSIAGIVYMAYRRTIRREQKPVSTIRQ